MRELLPLSVFALALSLPGQPAVAQTTNATITQALGCTGFIPTADGGIGELITTFDTVVVVKSGGSTSLSCHFDIPAAIDPKITARVYGFACYTWLGLTNDSRMQVSSGGKGTLSCRIR